MQIAPVILSLHSYGMSLYQIINLEERAALRQYHRYPGNYYEEIPATWGLIAWNRRRYKEGVLWVFTKTNEYEWTKLTQAV